MLLANILDEVQRARKAALNSLETILPLWRIAPQRQQVLYAQLLHLHDNDALRCQASADSHCYVAGRRPDVCMWCIRMAMEAEAIAEVRYCHAQDWCLREAHTGACLT